MILAAGLGTRLRPLSDLRAKPALPVRGRPVISLLLQFLSKQGCSEVMINLHHRPESIRAAVAADHPTGLGIEWSEEIVPLGTGGGIRRAANFLSEDDACIVLAGDMLLDIPLKDIFDRHIASDRQVTLLLRRDPRSDGFGTIGVGENGEVLRIGERILQTDSAIQEMAQGLFIGVRIFSTEILKDWPVRDGENVGSKKPEDLAFEDLRDWLIPGIEERGLRVGAEILAPETSVWEPVGTPAEYLRANLTPPILPTLGGRVKSWGGNVEIRGKNRDVIVSNQARVPEDAELERCIIWDGEELPLGFRGQSGVYAGGAFHRFAEVGSGEPR